jgi:oligoribonuclease NrnB/cAMP/cGMP phosphodiesterase (DHH superfamily)
MMSVWKQSSQESGMSKVYILYHDSCMDGLAAAYVAHKNYRRLTDEIELIPVQYQQPLPSIEDNSYVVIVDFSYPKDVLIELAKRSQLPNTTIKFDMAKCGAVLAWEHWFDDPVPELLLYIQDRDLWQWKLPNSREISAGLQAIPKHITRIQGLIENWSFYKNQLITNGMLLLSNQQQVVESLAKRAEVTKFLGYDNIPIINSCTLQSELGEELLKNHPQAKFAVVYFHPKMYERVFSLRSRGNFDVSELARRYGGGSHAAAAGFKVGNTEAFNGSRPDLEEN